jgi:hypothetical protein
LQFRKLIAHSYETLMTRGIDFSLYRKSANRFAGDKSQTVEPFNGACEKLMIPGFTQALKTDTGSGVCSVRRLRPVPDEAAWSPLIARRQPRVLQHLSGTCHAWRIAGLSGSIEQ